MEHQRSFARGAGLRSATISAEERRRKTTTIDDQKCLLSITPAQALQGGEEWPTDHRLPALFQLAAHINHCNLWRYRAPLKGDATPFEQIGACERLNRWSGADENHWRIRRLTEHEGSITCMNARHPLRLVRGLMLLINNDQTHFMAQCTDRRSRASNEMWPWQHESRMRIKPLTLARSGMDQFRINARCGEECVSCNCNLRCLWDQPEYRSSSLEGARHDLCRYTTLARSWWPIKQRHPCAKICAEE